MPDVSLPAGFDIKPKDVSAQLIENLEKSVARLKNKLAEAGVITESVEETIGGPVDPSLEENGESLDESEETPA